MVDGIVWYMVLVIVMSMRIGGAATVYRLCTSSIGFLYKQHARRLQFAKSVF